MIEDYYSCSGGTTTTPDVCDYVTPTYSNVYVTDENNLYVYFDREMEALASITASTFTITITESSGTAVTDFTWSVPSDYYTAYLAMDSARFIYIELDIGVELNAGATVSILYTGGTVFADVNSAELTTTDTATGKLKANFLPLKSSDKSIAQLFGILTIL